jgi:hypothetical protein
MLKCGQRGEDQMDAETTCVRVPLLIIGHVCRKSPRRITILPPNGTDGLSIIRRHTSSTQPILWIVNQSPEVENPKGG